MKAVRLAVWLACGLAAALVTRAADRTGPAPADVIYPRAETAPAAAPDGSAATFAAPPVSSAGGLLPTLGYLVAFGLLIGGAWFLLKRGGLSRPFGKSDGRLRVLETRMLGNRQFLLVVEYDDAKLLLGVCPGRIDYLTPLAGHPLATGAMNATAGDDDDEPVPPAIAAAHASGR
jgi:flagellar biosynthetic protein FliO